MKKTIMILFTFLLLCVTGAFANTLYNYTTTTNSTDFMYMNTSDYVALLPSGNSGNDDYLFGELINVTPRLNFTIQINETVEMSTLGGYTNLYFHELNSTNVAVYNATSGAAVPSTNWSVTNITAGSARTFVLNSLGGNYEGEDVIISYNRTFIKNVDNLAGTYAYDICGSGCALVETNASASYGATIGWRLVDNPLAYTSTINGTSYAVEWSYTIRTSTEGVDEACDNIFGTISNSFSFATIALLILAVSIIIGVLVSAATTDIKIGLMSIILSAILLLVGYLVIAKIYASIC